MGTIFLRDLKIPILDEILGIRHLYDHPILDLNKFSFPDILGHMKYAKVLNYQ